MPSDFSRVLGPGKSLGKVLGNILSTSEDSIFSTAINHLVGVYIFRWEHTD